MARVADGVPASATNGNPALAFPRSPLAQVAGIALAPLLIALLGLSHPAQLTDETAGWWRDIHIILIPLFPLLGVNLWWLLAGDWGPLAWLGRIAGFVYSGFYGALDVLAGVAAGTVHARAVVEGVPQAFAAETWLFAIGNDLAEVGVWAFLLGCLVVSGHLLARSGRRALPGATLLCAAAIVFLRSHIYFPVGVLAMLGLAAGFGLLQWARLYPAPAPARPTDD